MKTLESIVAMLFPSILVSGTPWQEQWDRQQNESFVRACRVAYPTVAIGYAANYFLFDVPMGLEPIDFWMRFRFSMCALFMVVFAFYTSSLAKGRFYRWPAYASAFAMCYSQAWVTVWYGNEAWFFFFLFIVLTVLVLRFNVFQSILWSSVIVGVSTPVLFQSGLSISNYVSGCLVTLVSSVIVRAGALTDVQLFLSRQENEEAQHTIIENNEQFTEHIRSYIPRVIAGRLTRLMKEQRLSVVEASIEALQARKKEISCLFTDIRGFTQGSKDLDGFIAESVLPEVTACSNAVEQYEGIPRKVGDLLFAYFDEDRVEINVLRALLAGIQVARINEAMNETSGSAEIRRYILVSSGLAVVGNFGGLDSSIEITALGSPVNYLSRIDELTKTPQLSEVLRAGDILIDSSTLGYVKHLSLFTESLSLDSWGLAVRDFPEVREIYLLRDRVAAEQLLSARLSGLIDKPDAF